MQPGRLLTAMVTPFDDEGLIDYKQARRLAVALLNSGSDGLIVSGSTGESPTLTTKEKLTLFEEIKNAVGDKGTVIAGTGNYCTEESCSLSREAEKTGVHGLLLVVPYYNKPSQEGLYQHFKAIAASTKLPCILYNVPTRTITNLAAETVLRLSQIPNIIGVKEASANYEQIAKIIEGTPRGFLVYSGNDSDTFPIMALGGYGVISVASHLVGKQIKQMIELFLKGKVAESAALHRKLLPLVNSLFLLSNPVPLKYALNQAGFSVGIPRLPLTPPDEKTAQAISAALKNYKIDLPV